MHDGCYKDLAWEAEKADSIHSRGNQINPNLVPLIPASLDLLRSIDFLKCMSRWTCLVMSRSHEIEAPESSTQEPWGRGTSK